MLARSHVHAAVRKRSQTTANVQANVLALVVAIEDQLRICFEPEDDEQAVTLDDVVRIVSRRLAEKAEAGA